VPRFGGFTTSLDTSVKCKVTANRKRSEGDFAEKKREAVAKGRRGNEIFTRGSYILGVLYS